MDIKVREVTNVDSKSSQEIEQELLEKHENQFSEESSEQPVSEENQINDAEEEKKEEPVLEDNTSIKEDY